MQADTATTLTAIGTILTGCATLVVAFANLWYARATSRYAKAASDAVQSQADTASKQIAAASEAAAKQNLATVVSSARLVWVDALRDDVSEFLSINDTRPSTNGLNTFGISVEEASQVLRRSVMLRNRIAFRLDNNKPLHQQLLDALDHAAGAEPRNPEAGALVRVKAHALFDREWRRAREEAAGREFHET